MDSKDGYAWKDDDLVLYLKVTAGASDDEMTGETLAGHGGARALLRIKVAAPPIEGKANKRLRKYLAGCFDVPGSSVIITKGEGRRYKQVRIVRPKTLPAFISR